MCVCVCVCVWACVGVGVGVGVKIIVEMVRNYCVLVGLLLYGLGI